MKRIHDWTIMLASEQVCTNNYNKCITEEVLKYKKYNVMQFDSKRFYFMVHETVNKNEGHPIGHLNVELKKQRCNCEKFQFFHLSRSHVIVTCSIIRKNYTSHIHIYTKLLMYLRSTRNYFLSFPPKY